VLTRRSIVLTAALGAVVALMFPATTGQAARALAVEGGSGVGDEYFPGYGNSGYDVSHYDLRLKYTPASDTIQGTATLVLRPKADLTRFNLDFALTPGSVRVNGAKATVKQTGTEVEVTPARALRTGALTTVVVEYSGVPSQVQVNGENYWVRTPDGAIAVGEPEIAAWWFPSNDHPTDKATFDISVAVPDGVEVLSNGVYSRTATNEPGWFRWNWRTTKPMTTYLAFLVIGQYEINQDTTPSGQPFISAYADGLGDVGGAARASIERTPEITEFLAERIGPYPFEAQGGVVPSAGLGFALENQTRPVYSPGFFRRGSNTSVVVHEMAHQWFGDSVSVAKWRNIWLNEGFATYAEWLWSEAQGEGTAQQIFDFRMANTPAESPFWQVTIGDPGAANIFSGSVYNRGAMALHALRRAVGDEAFFATIKKWTASKQYGNATIEEFIALAESVSGKQLDEVFATWLFTKGKPSVAPAAKSLTAKGGVLRPKSIDELDLTEQMLHAH
jgi:aminopeptidase N